MTWKFPAATKLAALLVAVAVVAISFDVTSASAQTKRQYDRDGRPYYGANGPNFVATMRRLEASRDTVDVVDDQHGQPTWTVDLATQIEALVAAGAPAGIYHGTASGETTWHGLAREVFTLAGADPSRVHPTTSAAFVRPAPRPSYSVLGHARWSDAGLTPMRDWRTALHAAWPIMFG